MAFGLILFDGEPSILDSPDSEAYKRAVRHTEKDFGLRMLSFYIPEPETKVVTVDLPFSSGAIDLTDANGVTPYADRKGLNFEFKVYDGDYVHWEMKKSEIASFLHGRKLKMVPDSDPAYYYNVRLQVDSNKSNKVNSTIVLTGTAEPFKYSLQASNEPWKWDPFNFETGIIRETTSDITVTREATVTIFAGNVPTCPEFYVSRIDTTLSVIYGGNTYKFANGPGKYRFPQIRVSGDEEELRLEGNGKVSVSYRGRYL